MEHVRVIEHAVHVEVFAEIEHAVAVEIFFAIFARFIGLWIQCPMTNAGISFPSLIMMTLRKVNPSVIVRAKITAVQAGLTEVYPITTRDLESHYLAGGNVPNVIRSLVAARRANIDLDWQDAQAIDLAGRDVLEAVRTSVYPKVIDCPDPAKAFCDSIFDGSTFTCEDNCQRCRGDTPLCQADLGVCCDVDGGNCHQVH